MKNLNFEAYPIEDFSQYHQQRIVQTSNHINRNQLSESSLPDHIKADLLAIWKQPTIVSTYKHAFLDPYPQSVIGGLLFGQLVASADQGVRSYHLVWETHPQGIGRFRISIPDSNNEIDVQEYGPITPNVPVWDDLTKMYSLKYNPLSHTFWDKAYEDLTNGSGASQKPAVDDLLQIYKTHPALQSPSMTTLCIGFENTLVKEVFGDEIQRQIPPTNGCTSSGFHKNVVDTLKYIGQNFDLGGLLANVIDEKTAGNLFVGGSGESLIKIGYSTRKHRFQLAETEIYDNRRKIRDRNPISEDELWDYLDKGQVTPTGIPTFLSLSAASTTIPIAHLGNDYEVPKVTTEAFKVYGLKNLDGYFQVTDNYKDCWPPIVIPGPNDSDIFPSLASLFLWSKLFDFDIKKALEISIKQGHPTRVTNQNLRKKG